MARDPVDYREAVAVSTDPDHAGADHKAVLGGVDWRQARGGCDWRAPLGGPDWRRGLVAEFEEGEPESPPPDPGHRYWRVNIASTLNGNFISCAELKAALTHGGGNVLRGSATGTPTVSSQFGGSGAVEGSDLNPYTQWITASGTTGTLQWRFTGTTADIRKVVIVAQETLGEETRSPKDFTIEYSDNGSSWTVALTVTNQTSWPSKSVRRFDVPSSGSHEYWRINVTAVDGGSFVEFADIVFIDNINGIMQSAEKALVRGDSDFSNANHAQRVVDGDTASGWTNNALVAGQDHLVLDFGVAVDLKEMKWTSRSGEGGRSPTSGSIEYSDDLSAWTPVYTITEAGWGSLEERTWQW